MLNSEAVGCVKVTSVPRILITDVSEILRSWRAEAFATLTDRFFVCLF